MGLHVTSSGNPLSQSLVLVHGWGHHAGVWDPLVPVLESDFHVHRVDLPGYGRASGQSDEASIQQAWQLTRLIKELASLNLGPSIWCGWSLGGMLATRFAQQYPDQVQGLVTLASNAVFAQQKAWPWAMPRAEFAQFKDMLISLPDLTLSRFLGLVAQGSHSARTDLRELKAIVAKVERPDGAVLLHSLNLLNDLDNRPALETLAVPQLHLFGEKDALVPVSASAAVKQISRDAEVEVLEGASHALFLSHQSAFVNRLKQFVKRVSQ